MNDDEITDVLALFNEWVEAHYYRTDTPGFRIAKRFWIKFLKKVKYIKKPKKKNGKQEFPN